MDVDSEQQLERARENKEVEVAQAGTKAGSKHTARIRRRVTLVCAECKRLGLKCDRRTPCDQCLKREVTHDCSYGKKLAPAQSPCFTIRLPSDNSSTSAITAPPNGREGSLRARAAIVCAECKRLKLRCDRRTPCNSCQARETVHRCVYSTGRGNVDGVNQISEERFNRKFDYDNIHKRVQKLERMFDSLTEVGKINKGLGNMNIADSADGGQPMASTSA